MKRRERARAVFTDQHGVRQTLKGKSCVDCERIETVGRRQQEKITIRYRCTLSGLFVCKCKAACCMFPKQNGWTPGFV